MNLLPWRKKKQEVEVLPPARGGALAPAAGPADLFAPFFRRWEEAWPSMRLDAFGPATLPAMRIEENDREVTVSVDLPGMEEKDLSVRLDGDTLIVRGERKSTTTRRHGRATSVQSYYRAVSLPGEIDPGNVKATYRRGVLHVTAAKRPDARPSVRHIPVRAA